MSAGFTLQAGTSVQINIAPIAPSSLVPADGLVKAKYSVCVDPDTARPGAFRLSFVCGFYNRVQQSVDVSGGMIVSDRYVLIEFFQQGQGAPKLDTAERVVKAMQASVSTYAGQI